MTSWMTKVRSSFQAFDASLKLLDEKASVSRCSQILLGIDGEENSDGDNVLAFSRKYQQDLGRVEHFGGRFVVEVFEVL